MGAKTETEDGAVTFAARLRNLRLKRGWSQVHLSNRSGISQNMISHLELGVRNPSYSTQGAIAKAFGLKLGKLMENVEG